jgi:class 3 adenylate cyclase/pimeloyl-ACP methyl ester carboxylesterase
VTTFGYARPEDGVYIGYRVDGDGPIDVVWQPEWPGNIDMFWASPVFGPWLRALASFARVITHDHRGVGLSSRDVTVPTLETRVGDLMSVLKATATRRPVLVGLLASGAVHALFAAMHPNLPRALVWVEPMARYAWAPDYPWGVSQEEQDIDADDIDHWGTDAYAKAFVEEQDALNNPLPPEAQAFIPQMSRNACTPDTARRLNEMWYETDVRGVLDAVNVPTLILASGDRPANVEEAEHVASLMPSAEVRLMPGSSWTSAGRSACIDAIREFVGLEHPHPSFETVLATVLFTDIVGSTEREAAVGDREWRTIRQEHDRLIRTELSRFNGREIKTMGDGFLATFDGPARAAYCAQAIVEGVRSLGLHVRAGLHTGEIELDGDDVRGLAVAIGSRVGALAGPSEVLTTRTVKDLVAGSGLAFEDAGEHELKGVPDRWTLFRVMPNATGPPEELLGER